MSLLNLLQVLSSHWFGVCLAIFVLRALYRRYAPSLRGIPAVNFLATVSRWNKVFQVLSTRAERNLLEAHRKLGPIVRIAYNEVSIADPEAIPIIFDSEQRFVKVSSHPSKTLSSWKTTNPKKTDWYYMFGFPTPEDANLFSVIDPVEHKRMKRNVAPAFSMSALMALEEFVDSTVTLFIQCMDELAIAPSVPRSQRKRPINMVEWFQWYAFDVVGELSFSRRLGFLDTKSDVGNMTKVLDSFIQYASTVAMMPELHKFLFGNPLVAAFLSPPALVISDVTKQEMDRREADPDAVHSDIMDKIIQSQEKIGPEEFPHGEIFQHAVVNLSGGSDTTGIAMDSFIYHLLKNQKAYEKLQAEIDEAATKGNLSDPPRYSETNHQAMPYLAACIKEALRIHPPVTTTLPRHVPRGGAYICGRFFPGGTRVSVSPFVVARDKNLFGEDSDAFRPERWLECSPERAFDMENGCLHRMTQNSCQHESRLYLISVELPVRLTNDRSLQCLPQNSSP
ncbi:cytochrome P450 [Colletotrichum acutatum]|uniref:Cytochrome P450 n=1 Tax=Glomerella acutata TaxID=27357 RepID=A0AAD8UFR4_GLOAC|nr:cytochrome P450 [Colletotrichum acutatum]KAK1716120.1 cytochrome P450 [Colletotrichum acutatum]